MAAVVEQCWHRVPGGTAVATTRSLEALAARGDTKVVGIAARHSHPPMVALPAAVPVRHAALPRRILYDCWHHLGWPKAQRLAGDVDVVHATGGAVPPAERTPLVVTVHDLAFLHKPDWFTRRGVRFAVKALELARARAALVVVPSQTTARDCAEHDIEPERVRVVPWGVAAAPVTEADIASLRARHRLPETFALWVGAAEPRKNIPGLLAAAARTTSGVPLVLAGPDGWGLDLGALADAADAEVIRVGYLTDGELAALYAAARVLVYPSLMEGFGLPVLEAMAYGTPVVTSSGTATEEVCADPDSTVDPTDPRALAAAIDAVVTDDAEHARRSARALQRAGQLTWEATAEGLREVYSQAFG